MKQTACLMLLCLAVPAALAACTTTYDCEGVRAYMYAEQFPALDNPPGLDVPAPDASMAIPEVGGGPVRHYSDAADNSTPGQPTRGELAGCLVAPPPLPASAA